MKLPQEPHLPRFWQQPGTAHHSPPPPESSLIPGLAGQHQLRARLQPDC